MGFRRLLALVFTLSFGSIVTMLATKHPSNDRVWAADHARLPRISVTDSIVRIEDVRNFRYRDETHFTPGYETRNYNLNRLRSVWFVLTPFSTAWRGPAHSFVSFGFDDSSFVAISIEARREVTEEYGLLKGLGRNYELIYVAADERDLIGKRAAFGGFDVYLYPVRAPAEKIRAMFLGMLDRAERLRTRPEFYNTISNNCTSNLVTHVNQVTAGRIPLGLKLLFPGYADDVAQGLGLLPQASPLDLLRRRYRINDLARQFAGAPDFSLRIRQGIFLHEWFTDSQA